MAESLRQRKITDEAFVEVLVQRLAHGKDLPLPSYQSASAAGLDLLAAVPSAEPLVIAPGGRALVPTGIAIALARGYEGQVRPRSGLAARHGLTVLNSPGTIDADYRGEVQVLLVNLGDESGDDHPRHAHRSIGNRTGCTRTHIGSRISRQNLTRKRRFRFNRKLKRELRRLQVDGFGSVA